MYELVKLLQLVGHVRWKFHQIVKRFCLFQTEPLTNSVVTLTQDYKRARKYEHGTPNNWLY